ncbi:MAG TPA: ACT domain-containing protein [Pseudonocardiaceae bacterium]|nr:ACT domain-containing protein [Pseudonocardiaceae bacterium]
MRKLAIDVRPDEYTVLRLDPATPIPAGLFTATGLVSIIRTEAELSLVCPSGHADGLVAERIEPGWRLLTVRGPLEFSLTGIMAMLAGTLAAAGVTLFALSSFDTDHVLVRATDLDRAIAAFREAGHEVNTATGE